MGFTEQQIDSVFRTSKTTWKYVGVRNGLNRTFNLSVVDAQSNAVLFTAKDQPSIETGKQAIADWIVKNRGGLTDVLTDDQARDAKVSEMQAQLDATNERLAAIVAASQPATENAEETPKPRRGRRAAEPDPVRTADDGA